MELKDIKSIYFIGAGGIGMSAIARYFMKKGKNVAGYDKTPSNLTRQLEQEGMDIHYDENADSIPEACKNKENHLWYILLPYPKATRNWLISVRKASK